MKSLAFISLLCLLCVLAGCDRSDKPAVVRVAQCIVSEAGGDQGRALGARAQPEKQGTPVHIARFDHLSCRGLKGLLDNDATMDAQGFAVSGMLLKSRPFRQAMLSTSFRLSGKSVDVSDQLAQLVTQVGANYVARAWASSCNLSSESINSTLRDLEAPYLTAFLGVRGLAASAAAAQAMAGQLAEQGKLHALYEADTVAVGCQDATMKAAFDQHVAEMKQFAAGSNPLVPGCQASLVDGELALRCVPLETSAALGAGVSIRQKALGR